MAASLTFDPYIPQKFDGTLILGESTFRGKTHPRSITGWGAFLDEGFPRDYIKKHVEDNILNDVYTFRKLRESFAPALDAHHFWERKAFTNFIPKLLADSHTRPTEAQWAAGHREFQTLLGTVQPKRILVVGKALWEHLPAANQETDLSCLYHDNIFAMWIPHPSWWNRAKPSPYTSAHAQVITAELMRHG